MKVMIELPNDRYFAVPREVLEQYAVPKAQFESELDAKWARHETVFHPEVEAQQLSPPRQPPRPPVTVLGIRG